MNRKELRDLESLVEREISFHLRNRSNIILESAVASLLDCYSVEEAAERLEIEARNLRDFG